MADNVPEQERAGVEDHPSHLADHELLRCVGHGSYGTVWLARSVLGTYRAIKIVYRRNFEEDVPYEREFRGIKKFEPVSRSHQGLVNLLQVGRNDEAGYFYYVMELADDASTEQTAATSDESAADKKNAALLQDAATVDPKEYKPKTLKTVLSRRGSLKFNECVELGLSLTSALDHLHRHQLIHRDLKPSNIIFVNDRPKIADIGLVTDLGSSRSFVGTDGFYPPEGPGHVQADIYGLGKVLYEASTGLDRLKFPIPPDDWTGVAAERWTELNEVLLKACEKETDRRYRSADEMHSDLEVLRGGKSVKRLRLLERRLAMATRLLVAFGLMLFLAAGAYYMVARAQKLTQRRLAESYVAYATRSVNENDLVGALPWFAQAFGLEQGDARREQAHRVRLAMVLRQCPKLTRAWFQAGENHYAEFNPEGTRVVAGWDGGKALVWDISLEQPVLRLEGHKGAVRGATFSKDGQFIATGATEDGAANIWLATDGRLITTLSHTSGVQSVQFHPLKHELLLTASGSEAQLWDWKAQRIVIQFINHTNLIRRARFSPDGRRLVTASEGRPQGVAQVWDVSTGEPLGKPIPHGSWVYDAEFSPDGQFLVTGAFDDLAGLYEVETGRQLWTWPHEAAVASVAFSPDGRYLATASWDASTLIWDLHRKSLRPAFPPLKHNGQVHCVRFDASGRRLLTASASGVLTVWDLAPVNWRPQLLSDIYSGDGKRFLSVTNQALQLWDASSGKAISTPIPITNELHGVFLNRDAGRLVVCVKAPGPQTQTNIEVRLWDVLSNPPQPLGPAFPCGFPLSRRWTVRLSDNGERLVAFQGKTGVVWHARTGAVLRRFQNERTAMNLSLDRAGRYLAFPNGTNAEVWEATGTNAPRLLSHPLAVWRVEFNPDGDLLATCCLDVSTLPCDAQIWDVRTGKKVGPPLKHGDGIHTATFDADGKRMATSSEDETAQIWEVATGRRLTPPLRHRFQVFHASFSPDGRWIATVSRDQTARVWNAETGEAVTPPLPHEGLFYWARFVANGTAILTTDPVSNQSLRWKLFSDSRPLQELEQLARLLSAHTVDPIGGALPIASEDMETLWQELRAKYPRDFSVTPEEVLRWHERELEKTEADKHWSAALFQIDQLLKLKPDDARLLERKKQLVALGQ